MLYNDWWDTGLKYRHRVLPFQKTQWNLSSARKGPVFTYDLKSLALEQWSWCIKMVASCCNVSIPSREQALKYQCSICQCSYDGCMLHCEIDREEGMTSIQEADMFVHMVHKQTPSHDAFRVYHEMIYLLKLTPTTKPLVHIVFTLYFENLVFIP